MNWRNIPWILLPNVWPFGPWYLIRRTFYDIFIASHCMSMLWFALFYLTLLWFSLLHFGFDMLLACFGFAFGFDFGLFLVCLWLSVSLLLLCFAWILFCLTHLLVDSFARQLTSLTFGSWLMVKHEKWINLNRNWAQGDTIRTIRTIHIILSMESPLQLARENFLWKFHLCRCGRKEQTEVDSKRSIAIVETSKWVSKTKSPKTLKSADQIPRKNLTNCV